MLFISKKKLKHIFKIIKKTMNIKIWHRRFVYLNYRKIISNAQKIIDMKIKKLISKNVYKSCLKIKQQTKLSKYSRSKLTIFLNKIHVDIESSLFITFRNNRFFYWLRTTLSIYSSFIQWKTRTKSLHALRSCVYELRNNQIFKSNELMQMMSFETMHSINDLKKSKFNKSHLFFIYLNKTILSRKIYISLWTQFEQFIKFTIYRWNYKIIQLKK